MSEKPYPTIEDTEEYVDCIIAKFLPGYLKRHRAEIMAAVHEDYKSGLYCSWASMASVKQGAKVVLDLLSEVLPKNSTESPQEAVNSSSVGNTDHYEI